MIKDCVLIDMGNEDAPSIVPPEGVTLMLYAAAVPALSFTSNVVPEIPAAQVGMCSVFAEAVALVQFRVPSAVVAMSEAPVAMFLITEKMADPVDTGTPCR